MSLSLAGIYPYSPNTAASPGAYDTAVEIFVDEGGSRRIPPKAPRRSPILVWPTAHRLTATKRQSTVARLRFMFSNPLVLSSTRRRFYPQRPSGHIVVTGSVPCPPQHRLSFVLHIGFSVGTARRFTSFYAISYSCSFGDGRGPIKAFYNINARGVSKPSAATQKGDSLGHILF